MNKYFKYILLTISLFFVGSMKVEADIKCNYSWIDSNGQKNTITMRTKNNGESWYKDTGMTTYWKKENIIDGLSYPITSIAECPKDGEINLKKEEYSLKNRPEIVYDKYTVGDTPPTLHSNDDRTVGKNKKEEALDRAQGGNSVPINPQNPGTTSCQSLFAGLEDELKKIFNAIKIVVPILVIVFSSLDFAKAIFGGSDDDVKKSQIKFVKRLVVAFVFFLLPTLMAFAMGIMDVIYNGGNFDCLILN